MPTELNNLFEILNSSAKVAMQIDGIKEDALHELYIRLFSKENLPSSPPIVTDSFLMNSGVYIGGFLYFMHIRKEVDYKFFKLARGENKDENYKGYMIPYIDTTHNESNFDVIIDSLFYSHRSEQKEHIWEHSDDLEHLIPEYLAKTPFFLGADESSAPYLYVKWSDLAADIYSYRQVLCKIAGVEWGEKEAILWGKLAKNKTDLTEIEVNLLENFIYSSTQNNVIWSKFFEVIDQNKIDFFEAVNSCVHAPSDSGFIDSKGQLRSIHRKSRFPLLAYLYWNLLTPDRPKTHLVIPIWQDLLNKPYFCNKFDEFTDTIKSAETRITGLAVLSIRPADALESSELTSIQVAILLSKFLTLPQVAASHYNDIAKEQEEKIKHQSAQLVASRRAAVAAIASQSLSHNIGSHALSDSKLLEMDNESWVFAAEGIRDFHQYLQGRMDYVAQLISTSPLQAEPMYLFGDVLSEFFRQRLLLDRLIADREVEGADISFLVEFPVSPSSEHFTCEVSRSNAIERLENQAKERAAYADQMATPKQISTEQWELLKNTPPPVIFNAGDESVPDYRQLVLIVWADIKLFLLGVLVEEDKKETKRERIPFPGFATDLMVDLPGGAVGCHALFGTFENMMRNSAKYGGRVQQAEPYRLSIRVRDPGSSHDFWLLELWDNFSGFDNTPTGTDCYAHLAATFAQGVLDKEGQPRTSGHGLVEIKEAMRFLHPHLDCIKDDGGSPAPFACGTCQTLVSRGSHLRSEGSARDCCFANLANIFHPDYDGTMELGSLVFRIRLRRPRLLGVWDPHRSDDIDRIAEGIFYRHNLTGKEASECLQLAELGPHLMVILDNVNVEISKVVKEVTKEHWRLPFRLMIVTEDARFKEWQAAIGGHKDGGTVLLPRCRARVICDDTLAARLALPPKEGNGMSLVNAVYNAWIRAYKPLPNQEKWHLSVSFERGSEMAERWARVKDFNNADYVATISLFDQASGKMATASVGVVPKIIDPQRVILFANHDAIPDDFINNVKNGNLRFYQSMGSNEAPRTFNTLYAPPSDPEGFAFFTFTVIEAALTTVAVFDERIIATAFSGKAKNGKHLWSTTRIIEFWSSGVVLLNSIPSGLDGIAAFARKNVPNGELEPAKYASTFLTPFVSIRSGTPLFAGSEFDKPNCDQTPTDVLRSGRYDNSDTPVLAPDVIVMHEGLIEELVKQGELLAGQDIIWLQSCARIVRTSGKGRDERELDPRHPFAEYSSISLCFAPYNKGRVNRVRIEKLMLARTVLNSTGITSNGENR